MTNIGGGAPSSGWWSKWARLLGIALVAIVLMTALVVVIVRNNSPVPSGTGGASPDGTAPEGVPSAPSQPQPDFGPVWADLTCPPPTLQVHDATELQQALDAAQPGAVIKLADGSYRQRFSMAKKGTAVQPIWVCGSPNAVIEPGDQDTGTAFDIEDSAYVALQGFSIRNSLKGVMVRNSAFLLIDGLSISDLGHEGIHLYENTVSSVVSDNSTASTGLVEPNYGEGIYLGTSQRRWGEVTHGEPDATREILVLRNKIANAGAEGIEAKEGTTGGLIEGNSVDGHLPGSQANGWIMVGGNDWTVRENTGSRAVKNGIRVQGWNDDETGQEWGTGNRIEANSGAVDAPGFGVSVYLRNTVTVITCDNKFTGAAQGLTNAECRS